MTLHTVTTSSAAPRVATAQAMPTEAPAPKLPAVAPKPSGPIAEAIELGFDEVTWKILTTDLYPAAKDPGSILRVLRRCHAQGLDPFDRPFHIVPMWDSKSREGKGGYVDSIWPSIEYQRMKAHRSGVYAGMEPPTLGPEKTKTWKARYRNDDQSWREVEYIVTFYEWVAVTVYRKIGNDRVPFSTPPIYWEEAVATTREGCPNEMWRERPRGQHFKCAEAAALRMAFPEFAGDLTAEEMAGKSVTAGDDARDVTPKDKPPAAAPTSRLDALKNVAGVDAGKEPAPKAETKPPSPPPPKASPKADKAEDAFKLSIDIGDGNIHVEKHSSASAFFRAYWKQAAAIDDRVEPTDAIRAAMLRLVELNASEASRAAAVAPNSAKNLEDNMAGVWRELRPADGATSVAASTNVTMAG